MSEPKFKIGDRVFMGRYDRVGTHVVCPDCLGSKKVKVVLGDGSEWNIECGGCDPGGYIGSTGTIKQYEYTSIATPHKVTAVKASTSGVSYELDNFGGGSYYVPDENKVFSTSEEAMADADKQKADHEAEENRRLMAKTKDAKSWAWNLTYHRRCIKDHERQLEYHRAKVQLCESKTKDGK